MIAYPPTATQLNSIYLRLAAAFRRQQARRLCIPSPVGEGQGEGPEPLTITTGGHGGSGRGPASVRGPYRRRTQRLNRLSQDTES